jgi:hypothetical protein
MTSNHFAGLVVACAFVTFFMHGDWPAVIAFVVALSFAAFVHFYNVERSSKMDKSHYEQLESKISGCYEEIAKLRLRLGLRSER